MTRTARQTRDAIVSGAVRASEVIEQTLEGIDAVDGTLHAFLTVDAAGARRQAAELDRRLAAGESPGPLWGVPFSVKDTYDTAGLRTTYGSRVYESHVPDKDAELVRRVRAAGGVLVGKTNTPEFAIYIRTVNDLQPESVNPWDTSRTTGGSSGGAAASIAAGLTPIAIGSDGGGSVRIPAALCGQVGLMPSRGAIPRTGGKIGTRRFSSAGPMALDAADAALLYTVMAGPSVEDGLSRGLQPTGLPHSGPSGTPRMRWVGDSDVPGAESDVIETAAVAGRAFADALHASLDDSGWTLRSPLFSDAFYDMMQSDRVSTGGDELLGSESKRNLLTGYGRHQFERGRSVPGSAYSRGIEVQLQALEHMERLLGDVDVVVTPTLGFIAPQIPEGDLALPEDARRGFVAFTFLMNYTGIPAVTVPCGLVRGMPVGLQFIGRQGAEPMLLHLAQLFQERVFRLPPAPIHVSSATEEPCR